MPAPSTSRWLSCLAVVAWVGCGTALSGCGDDLYPVVVSWAVNGLAPTAEVCERYDIDRVVLTVHDGARDRTMEADCASSLFLSDGYEYGGFVTTDSFEYDVTYVVQIDMLASDGTAIISHKTSFNTGSYDVTPVELNTLDFLSPFGNIAAVTGAFSVGSGDQAQACADAGINRVELWVYSVLDFDLEAPAAVLYADCESGVLDSGPPLLDFGDYQVTYVALDYQSEEELTVIEESEPIPVYVDAEGVVDLPSVRFRGK